MNHKILLSEDFNRGVKHTRSVCLYGMIGWAFVGCGLWAIGILLMVFNNGWSGRRLSGIQVVQASPLLLLVAMPFLFLNRHRIRARKKMYAVSDECGMVISGCTTLVYGIALPGIVIGGITAAAILLALL